MKPIMTCPVCGDVAVEPWPPGIAVPETGLENVILKGDDVFRCPRCGEGDYVLHGLETFLRPISLAVLCAPRPLTSREIRFLRKELELTVTAFARLLGVTRVTVSRWENGLKRPPKSADHAVRLLSAAALRVPRETWERLESVLKGAMKAPAEITIEVSWNASSRAYSAIIPQVPSWGAFEWPPDLDGEAVAAVARYLQAMARTTLEDFATRAPTWRGDWVSFSEKSCLARGRHGRENVNLFGDQYLEVLPDVA